MSSTEEVELKAGHPPAVKAGGMRVARHRQASSGEEAAPKPVVEETKEGEEEEFEETPQQDKANVVISGAVTKGDKDFPPEAIKQYHDKPVPNKQKMPPQPQQKHHIQQPR